VAKRVCVAMSGGVDSSTTAHLLKQEGYDVFGLMMRVGEHHPPEEIPIRPNSCCDAGNLTAACRVAEQLGIAFHSVDYSDAFARLVDDFCAEYRRGRTPNPCIRCNTELKFGRMWRHAQHLGADCIATGHYARIAPADGEPALWRGVDTQKDQSYVLFGLERSVLPHVLLPLGDRTKAEVRKLAADIGLPVQDRPESQEICFVVDDDYRGLIQRWGGHGAATAGEIVDVEGQVVGTHDGFERFTIGQRRGIGVAMGEPYYVVRIEPDTGRVVVGTEPYLHAGGLVADRVNWLADVSAGETLRARAQIRYHHRAADATLTVSSRDEVELTFDEPQKAVTPGQAVVFYRDDRVLGGGWIQRSIAR